MSHNPIVVIASLTAVRRGNLWLETLFYFNIRLYNPNSTYQLKAFSFYLSFFLTRDCRAALITRAARNDSSASVRV
jgi:hypothetical protein